MSGARSLFAPHALLPEGWARDVLLSWDERGALVQVTPHAAAPAGVPVAAGPLLPGMPNLHSHAFQRGMAGLTEYRSDAVSEDSFWSWRQLMYRFALRLQPAQLEAMAYGLYVEMLEAGYTAVCEFHYVHHHTDGRPYADDAELALAVLRAARRAGIGLTLLPVLYQTSGFGAQPPGERLPRASAAGRIRGLKTRRLARFPARLARSGERGPRLWAPQRVAHGPRWTKALGGPRTVGVYASHK